MKNHKKLRNALATLLLALPLALQGAVGVKRPHRLQKRQRKRQPLRCTNTYLTSLCLLTRLTTASHKTKSMHG